MKKVPEVGQLVVMNHTADATMFRVVDIGPRAISVIDATIEDRVKNQRPQWVDLSCAEFPTVLQRRKFVDADTSAA